MANSRKPITFLPTEEVRQWYDRLEEGQRTKIINQYLMQLVESEIHMTMNDRIRQLESVFLGMKKQLETKPWLKDKE
jgi:hypothetical protein